MKYVQTQFLEENFCALQVILCPLISLSSPAALVLACDADVRLFSAVISDPGPVLQKHIPKAKQINYYLRPRAHGFRLPAKDDRNFIPRLRFRDMY